MDSYAKSSCNCYNCNKKVYCEKTGNPTNMAVSNCEIPLSYQCYDNKVFLDQIEPQNKSGYETLNPQVIQEKQDRNFYRAKPNNDCCESFTSIDPRLVSIPHSGQVLTLDRVPITGYIDLEKINTDTSLNCYGQNYKTYSDINTGQIVYYIDKNREDAFYSPNFSIPSRTIGSLYKDPMGSIRPQYNRYPIEYKNPISNHNDGSNLTWLNDSGFHREDLISKQMLKRNEQRWSPRWQ